LETWEHGFTLTGWIKTFTILLFSAGTINLSTGAANTFSGRISGIKPMNQESASKRGDEFTRWMLRLSRSLSRFETQDIMTQPQFNH
jgi:hypothetical protein